MIVKKNKFIKKIKFCSFDLNNKKDVNLFLKSVSEKKKIISFLNPHSLVVSKKNNLFLDSLNKMDYVFSDGIGTTVALNLFNKFKFFRITGLKITELIIKKTYYKKFFFLGSDSKSLKLLKKNILSTNSTHNVRYFSPDFVNKFSTKHNSLILKKINNFKPDFLFIGMTAPKQEIWSQQNKKKILSRTSIFNVGAVLDYLGYSNIHKKIIIFMSILGLEWLYRLFFSPRKMWRRTFISFPIFILEYLKYVFKLLTIKIKIIENLNIINNLNSFCLVAFNLSAISLLPQKFILKFHFWADGIIIKFFLLSFKKTPGRDIFKYLKLLNLKKIIVIGNLNNRDNLFLQRKFMITIENYKVPYANVSEIIKYLKKKEVPMSTNYLYLITLPTPKQEYIANFLYKKKMKIICIGGGLALASGSEKVCPNFMYLMGLEFLWRLQFETGRRLIRLLISITLFIYKILNLSIFRLKFRLIS
jgi:N-acetylglucosaminyldiphosphoundecaprenol N-acetyl-beta-D-mannosaminyltransferase